MTKHRPLTERQGVLLMSAIVIGTLALVFLASPHF